MIEGGEVVSAFSLESCLAFKSKVYLTTDKLGECVKCNMLQHIDRYHNQLRAMTIFSIGAHYNMCQKKLSQ